MLVTREQQDQANFLINGGDNNLVVLRSVFKGEPVTLIAAVNLRPMEGVDNTATVSMAPLAILIDDTNIGDLATLQQAHEQGLGVDPGSPEFIQSISSIFGGAEVKVAETEEEARAMAEADKTA